MVNYIILLTTSKDKTKDNLKDSKPYRYVQNFKKNNYFLNLQNERELIYDKIREFISISDERTLKEAFNLDSKEFQTTIEYILDILNQNVIMAIGRFTGNLFKEINYDLIKDETIKDRFDESVILIDGFFGMLKPTDLIPFYNLDINSRFLDINLVDFWKISLNLELKKLEENKIIIDLLSLNERKIFSNDSSKIKIDFTLLKDLNVVSENIDIMKLKAQMVKYILTFDFLRVEDLKLFSYLGYKFNEKLSKNNTFIYTK